MSTFPTDDAIESIVGRFGRYHIWIFCLITIGQLPTHYQLVNVVFLIPNVDYVCMDENAYNITGHCPCENPEYDRTYIVDSVTTWNLICEKSYIASIAQATLQIGILGGSLFYGHISDRYGRRPALLLALSTEVLFVALSAAASEFWMFIVLRFLIGTAVGGTMLCNFVMMVELSGKTFRPYLAALCETSYIISYLTLPIIAYFVRNWRHLQMATSLPWIFVIFYYNLIPESPRWLITKGKIEQAVKTLTLIAQKNERPTYNIRDIVKKIGEEASTRTQIGSYFDLFKTPKIKLYTLLLAYVWLCCSHTFFGINQYIGRLQGNLYLNVILSAVSLIPGLFLVAFACAYLKRKISVVTSFVIAGVSLLILIFVPPNMESLELTLAIIGQIGAYTAFAQIYLYSSETFPTVIRNSAMGFLSVFARIGGFIAPFVVNIGVEWVSLVIFSVLAFMAASLFYFLPETKDVVLHNTIEQTEKPKNENMSEEDAIETVIGRFGRYQTWIFILVTLGRFPTEYQLVNVVFVIPNAEFMCMDEEAYNISNHCPCKNPQYDQNYITSSVTSTWDLICENRQLTSLAQSMLHVGILGGSLLYGHISDRYGRKLACILALICEVVFTALSAAVPYFWMFVVLRFFIGTAIGGTMLCCYIILIELSGKSFRPYLTGLIEISYIMSYFSLPIIAYFLRDWRHLQLATALPWSFVIFYYCLIPESPRWLITTGKKEKAIEVLTYIALKNKQPTENIAAVVEKIQEETLCNGQKKFGSYLDLFRTPKIRTYALLTAYVWMCCSFSFFGINQYIGRLQGNIYLNVMLSAASLVPGLFLVVFAALYLNRKVGVVTSFIVAGSSLLVFIFIPSDMNTLGLVFAIIGQIGAYTAFIQVYLFSSEIFPTIIRNSAMGFASVFARFGGFIAPFVVNIGIEWVSITILSVLAFLAASLCYFLPETKDTVLLNTIEQTEKSRNNNIST